jgi:hypothetical protein
MGFGRLYVFWYPVKKTRVQSLTVLCSRVHAPWCSVFQSFMIAHFNTSVLTFYDCCWWTRMSPLAWQVSFSYCQSVVQMTVSSVMLSFIKWGWHSVVFCCFIIGISYILENKLTFYIEGGFQCWVRLKELVALFLVTLQGIYRLCHQSTACLNPWAVSYVCLVFVFCSTFALWLYSCTCCVRQYFLALAVLENIFLHMLC